MTDSTLVNICDVCSEIFAGGDAPKGRYSEIKTDEFQFPIYSNGEANEGLYGYTNFFRVNVPSITVSARGTIGYTAIRSEPFVPIVRLITLLPKAEIIDIKYLYYAIQNYNFIDNGTSIPQLTVPMLKKYRFCLPSMKEQKEIVNTLDKVTELVNKYEQQLSKLDELVKFRFVEMFGDPVTNNKEWNVTACKKLTTKIGSGATPRGGNQNYKKDGIVLIRSMNVYDGYFEYKDLAHIDEKQAKQLGNVTICENDILFNITGASVTRTCIVPKEVLPARVNQHVAIIRCNENINPIFINNLLINENFKSKLLNIAKAGGGTREAITKVQIENLGIIVPPIELQNEFATFVQQIDKLKFEAQNGLEKLETLKKSLMQRYF